MEIPTRRTRVWAELEHAHRLRQVCEQLNILCGYSSSGDWAVCETYVTPQQQTVLILAQTQSDAWHWESFEHSLEEQEAIEAEHPLTLVEKLHRFLKR